MILQFAIIYVVCLPTSVMLVVCNICFCLPATVMLVDCDIDPAVTVELCKADSVVMLAIVINPVVMVMFCNGNTVVMLVARMMFDVISFETVHRSLQKSVLQQVPEQLSWLILVEIP